MSRRTGRVNRIGLAIVGLLLVLAGVAALLRALNVMPGLLGGPDQPVTDQQARDFVADNGWVWPVLGLLLLLIGVLALRWLAEQTRTGAIETVRVEPDSKSGTTTVPARVAAAAVADDIDTSPQVRRVAATMVGQSIRPRLQLVVTMAPTADPAKVTGQVHQALERHRQALGVAELPTTVEVRTGN